MQDKNILKIDTDWQMNIPDEEGKQLQDLLKEFEQCYADNKDKPVLEWLEPKMQKHLPDRSQDEIHRISAEIVDSLKVSETNHEDLQKAVSRGRSKESWFASQKLPHPCPHRNPRNIFPIWMPQLKMQMKHCMIRSQQKPAISARTQTWMGSLPNSTMPRLST